MDTFNSVANQRYNVKPHLASNNVINVPSNKGKNPYHRTVDQVQELVSRLMETLNDSHSFEFYCKVAWNLPESVIWLQLEKAQEKGKPAAYFSKVCRVIMEKEL